LLATARGATETYVLRMHLSSLNNDECLKVIALISNSKLDNENVSSTTTYLNEAYDYDELNASSNIFTNSKLANLIDSESRTPLMLAVEKGHFNTINFLVNQMGADLLLSDSKQRTALHRAAALGYEESCVVMLKSNVNCLMQRDQNGLLPFTIFTLNVSYNY
jgi:ankyrin repeat protein